MSYVHHDPSEYNPGCFAYGIWFVVAIISFCMAFGHPLAALVVFIIGISIAGMVARASNTSEAYERMQERCSRIRRQPEITYRREVSVRETIYVAPQYRREASEFLEGVFRPLDE